jgi:hypothetical protein
MPNLPSEPSVPNASNAPNAPLCENFGKVTIVELWKEIIDHVDDARTLVLWASTCRDISYLVQRRIRKITEPYYWIKHKRGRTLAFVFYMAVDSSCGVCGCRLHFYRSEGKKLCRWGGTLRKRFPAREDPRPPVPFYAMAHLSPRKVCMNDKHPLKLRQLLFNKKGTSFYKWADMKSSYSFRLAILTSKELLTKKIGRYRLRFFTFLLSHERNDATRVHVQRILMPYEYVDQVKYMVADITTEAHSWVFEEAIHFREAWALVRSSMLGFAELPRGPLA